VAGLELLRNFNRMTFFDYNYWYYSGCCGRLFYIISNIFFGTIILSIALGLAAIAYAVMIIPTMVIQFTRLLKILGVWCCKTNDKRRKKKRDALV
jgi:hypothetical protein